MRLLSEFKTFAMRGNVVDMAVGIILGGAFGKIATSLVNDVLMPPIGLLLGRKDFSRLAVTLREAAEGTDAVTLRYGAFINTVVDFVIVALAMFLVVKGINIAKRREEQKAAAQPPPEPPAEVKLLTEIRDLLKSRA